MASHRIFSGIFFSLSNQSLRTGRSAIFGCRLHDFCETPNLVWRRITRELLRTGFPCDPPVPRRVASRLRQRLACDPATAAGQSSGKPTGTVHAVHQRAAAKYTSGQTLEDPETVQLCPRSSNAKKAFQGQQVQPTSHCVVVISDRNRAISASQKASLDKSPRMRPKISPMFTLSVDDFLRSEPWPSWTVTF